ncbi:hypothetical protein CDAR_442261 [Caerostris darwini]|uniref:Uncharacterized protein n=1 Tax=Caerostris darwini TaxID=1538125 RepID=A0AAV4V018_9ARAC|nr:hypothetical protein CDAR_442261 [Caerostris darwini]
MTHANIPSLSAFIAREDFIPSAPILAISVHSQQVLAKQEGKKRKKKSPRGNNARRRNSAARECESKHLPHLESGAKLPFSWIGMPLLLGRDLLLNGSAHGYSSK